MSDDSLDPASHLDVRGMHKPAKHPAIFARFDQLTVGQSFVLVNDHDPKHLRDEFEADFAGAYGWEYERQEVRDWRIRITRTASTSLPRVLTNTQDARAADAPGQGAVWKLQTRERDLDANQVVLPAGDGVGEHVGPDLDVLMHVLTGSGELVTENGTLELRPGALIWLPKRSRREIKAGDDGLSYLTVHQKRQSLQLDTTALRRPS